MRRPIFATILIAVCSARAAGAATFAVNNTGDAVDVAPGNGVCATAGSVCTLRAAIQEANAFPGTDTITLTVPGTYMLAIPGTGENAAATGDLDIASDMTIQGIGSGSITINGGALDRVFHVLSGAVAEIADVTITQGRAFSDDGGGVGNEGTLTLRRCVVTTNAADGTTFGGGGGVASNGTMHIIQSTISQNGSGQNAGGVGNRGTMTIDDSTINNNNANALSGYGGGGGIASSDIMGGAVSLTIRNTTISGNVTEGSGGGIILVDLNDMTTLTLNNVTITGNTADVSANGSGDGGGLANGDSFFGPGFEAFVNFQNTIIAGNTDTGGQAPDCLSDVGRPLTSGGFDLVGNLSGCSISGPAVLTGLPVLGPLAANGGPTKTHALNPGSPAINAGNPATPNGVGTACMPADQRGVGRPVGGVPVRCDIGAYEVTVCGDGIASAPAEQCDLGAQNGGNCCSPSCTVVDADGDGVCNANDNCGKPGTTSVANPDQRDSDGQGGGDVCDVCPLDATDSCQTDQSGKITLPPGGGTVATMNGATITCPSGAKCGSCTDAMKTACSSNIDCPSNTTCGPTSFSITGLNQSTCGSVSSFCAGSNSTNLIGGIATFGPVGRVFNDDPLNHPERDVTIEFRWLDDENSGIGDGYVNDRSNPAHPNKLPLTAETELKPFRDGKFLGTCSMAPQVLCTASDLPCPPTAGNCNDNKKCSQFPACPSASAICCDTANNKFVLKTYTFSEYAVGLDACAPIADPFVKIAKVPAPAGDDKLIMKGLFTMATDSIVNQNPLVHGVRIVLSDTPGSVLDLTIPPGAYDPVSKVGWKTNGSGSKWTYLNKSAAPPGGIVKVLVGDKSNAAPGRVQFQVQGKDGSYAAGLAVTATLVLPDADQCFTAVFPGPRNVQPICAFNGSGTSLKCK